MNAALVAPRLPRPGLAAGLLPHPLGVALGFWLIVVCFLAILGVMMLVGHVRDRRRDQTSPTTRAAGPGRQARPPR